MSQKPGKDLPEPYLEYRYPVTVYQVEEGGFVAEIAELSGCVTQGDTIDEAIANIEDAKGAWIQAAYDQGQSIPLPRTENEYSGRILVRLPRSLHKHLADASRREGISLNQHILNLLSAREAEIDLVESLKAQWLQQQQEWKHVQTQRIFEVMSEMRPKYSHEPEGVYTMLETGSLRETVCA